MNRLLIILIFMTIACSGEIVSSDQKLSESDLLENANQEISKLGKSIIEKNRIEVIPLAIPYIVNMYNIFL